MKIQEQDRYHGPALMQIVEHDSFKALNKADGSYGHYRVNADVCLLVKYRTNNGPAWRFTFSAQDVAILAKDQDNGRSLLVLVCGDATICALTADEYEALLDLDADNQQWISVESPEGKQLRCAGSMGALHTKVPHNRFPNIVFAED